MPEQANFYPDSDHAVITEAVLDLTPPRRILVELGLAAYKVQPQAGEEGSNQPLADPDPSTPQLRPTETRPRYPGPRGHEYMHDPNDSSRSGERSGAAGESQTPDVSDRATDPETVSTFALPRSGDSQGTDSGAGDSGSGLQSRSPDSRSDTALAGSGVGADAPSDAATTPDGVVRRRRERYRDGDLIEASTSWYAADLANKAPDLLRFDRIRQGTAQYVAECNGRTVTPAIVARVSGVASHAEAALLNIREGEAIQRSKHWFRADDARILEYGEAIRPERYAE